MCFIRDAHNVHMSLILMCWNMNIFIFDIIIMLGYDIAYIQVSLIFCSAPQEIVWQGSSDEYFYKSALRQRFICALHS